MVNYKIKNNLKSYVKKLISIFKNKKFNINDEKYYNDKKIDFVIKKKI